jgi:hypothetical protein
MALTTSGLGKQGLLAILLLLHHFLLPGEGAAEMTMLGDTAHTPVRDRDTVTVTTMK